MHLFTYIHMYVRSVHMHAYIKTCLPGEESMENSCTQHYSGQYIVIFFLFQHVQKLQSSYQIHTFQFPKNNTH